MDKDDHLLRRRDTMKESALQIASYSTRPDRKVGVELSRGGEGAGGGGAAARGGEGGHCRLLLCNRVSGDRNVCEQFVKQGGGGGEC
jgi:hypothetical protein